MRTHWLHRTCEGVAMLALSVAVGHATVTRADPVLLDPGSMVHIATVDPRYQSYNIEMAEVVGGKFWKPYGKPDNAAKNAAPASGASAPASTTFQIGQEPAMFVARPPVDLSNARLRTRATALGPAYVRVSGTWANSVFFQDTNAPAPTTPPKGFQSALTRGEWKGVVDFAQAVNTQLVTSLAISAGVRDAAGVWTPDQARELLAYTKSVGGNIAAAGVR